MHPNPFNVGSVRPFNYMFGRADEIRTIERWAYDMENGKHPYPLCFLGAPGTGKTSLLKYAREALRAKNWLCGYSEASPDAACALDDFLEDIRRATPKGKSGERFRSRLTEISVSAVGIGAGLRLDSNPNDYRSTAYKRTLELFTILGDAAKKGGAGVALLIDEAQTLPADDLRLLFRAVNNLDGYPVSLIIAGLPVVPTNVSGEKNPTSDVFLTSPILSLTRAESLEALSAPVRDAGGSIDDTQLRLMVRFAEGHVLTLQMLGARAWRLADDDSTGDRPLIIQARHTAKAINDTRRQLSLAFYEPIWSQCNEGERRFLSALASMRAPLKVNSLTWSQLLDSNSESLGLNVRNYHGARDVWYSLLGKGIVTDDQIHGHQYTKLAIPGFRQFVQQLVRQDSRYGRH